MIFKKRNLFRFLISGIAIEFFALCTYGSIPYTVKKSNPLYESWRWKTYTELSDKGIRCLTEGKNQSMWFGTGKGIYHYDGLQWQHYLDVNDVLKAPVYGLCFTTKDVLYAVSPKGICHYYNGIWQTDLLFPDNNKVLGSEWEILNIIETQNGEIWVGLYFGLVRIEKKKYTIFTTPMQFEGLEDFFSDAEIMDMTGRFEDLKTFIVFDILEDKTGNLWLGMEDGTTLRLYDKNHNPKSPGRYTLYTEADNMLLSRLPILYESINGNIYNISQSIQGGINTFDPITESWNASPLNNNFGGDNLNFSICETDNGMLWIGGLSRFFTFQHGTWAEYKQPELPVPPTRIIFYLSSDGSLWMVGHLADVIRIEYNTPNWKTYKDLLFQCETADGNSWFLNVRGQVIKYNKNNNSWEALDTEFPLSDPDRIFLDSSSTLWAIGSHKGVAALAWNSDGTWNLKTFADLCWSFHPNGFVQTKDNTVWFGANADCGDKTWGLIKYTPSIGSPYDDKAWHTYKGSDISQVAYALAETDDGNLLCGSYLGLFEFNGTNTRALHEVLIGDIIKVESMIKDPIEGVWIGTRSQGVIHYINDKNWTQYTMENGLASNSVSSIMISADSSLWVATDKGISRFDGKKWTRWALPDYFTITRGNGFLLKGNDNSIYVTLTTIEWYRRVFYNKEYSIEDSPLITYQITPETIPPETEITKYDRKVYYPGNAMIFWQGVDKWNATDPGQLQYSFRLDNKDWSEYTTERNHTFLSLRKGWHKLEVRTRDNFLNVDPTPATIKFKVIPPIWGQIWFILLITGFIGTIAYLLYSSFRRNRKMIAQNLEMKQKNEDLTKQQKEIEEKGKQIMELLEKERENQWLNEGVLLINGVIKEYNKDPQKLASKILENLIDYLQVNAGGIIVHRKDENGNKENDFLELVAAFGYNRERLEQKRMHINEGLAGACFTEKKTRVINNVPDQYFLGSGLGKAKMTELILVPMKMLEEIAGIIEISSLNTIEPRKIKLLELVSENIASNLLNLEAQSRIEKMLEVSKQQTEQLHEQEEELRQQMEELQATQEESRRREEELREELQEYRKKQKTRVQKKDK